MNGFLAKVAARALSAHDAILPRLPSIFEDVQPGEAPPLAADVRRASHTAGAFDERVVADTGGDRQIASPEYAPVSRARGGSISERAAAITRAAEIRAGVPAEGSEPRPAASEARHHAAIAPQSPAAPSRALNVERRVSGTERSQESREDSVPDVERLPRVALSSTPRQREVAEGERATSHRWVDRVAAIPAATEDFADHEPVAPRTSETPAPAIATPRARRGTISSPTASVPRVAQQPSRQPSPSVERRLFVQRARAAARASSPASPAAAVTESAPREPDVHISIGRVEVRASVAAPAARRDAAKPSATLDDYLRRREQKGRR